MVMENIYPAAIRTDGTSGSLRRFAESISAGFPSPAEGYEDPPLSLTDFIRHPAATFYHRMDDAGLPDEHILPGSVLVVDRSITAVPGHLVLIEDAGQFAVQRVTRDSGRLVVFGVVVAALNRY